jgi:hypothetical protein
MTVPVLYYLQKRQKPLAIPLADAAVRKAAAAPARTAARRAATGAPPALPAH